MKVITFSNEKGGVGKTTLALHMAAGMAVMGKRVVLIDADAQGNLTTSLGLQEEPCFYDLLVRKGRWQDNLRVITPELYEPPNMNSRGMLAVLPGNDETQLVQNKISDAYLIRKRLSELRNAVDVVIIDTSPTPSLLHGAIYLSTDAIIYPTQCEYLSLRGLVKTMDNVASAPDGKIPALGIIPNMYRAKTVEHSENLNALKERYGDVVWNPIPLSIIWTEAISSKRTVFSYAPASKAAGYMWRIVERTLKEIEYAQ